jgi:hypothetical protein
MGTRVIESQRLMETAEGTECQTENLNGVEEQSVNCENGKGHPINMSWG